VFVKLFHKVVDRFTNESHRLDFDYFASDNFIGMFVMEEAERFMKRFVTDLAEETKTIGNVVPVLKLSQVEYAFIEIFSDCRGQIE
jgi:nitrogen regulatory protein PII-like uncharacterized protein